LTECDQKAPFFANLDFLALLKCKELRSLEKRVVPIGGSKNDVSITPPKTIDLVREYIEVGEPFLAIETITAFIVENDIVIEPDTFSRIKAIFTYFETSDPDVKYIEKNLLSGPVIRPKRKLKS
jgi:hypothetical protein